MNAALNTIIEETFTVYAGVLIEKVGSNYVTLKHSFNNIESAKVFIDQSFFLITKSIK